MSLDVASRQAGGITVVDMRGKIVMGEGSVVVREVVRDLLATGLNRILMNLGDVDYIDSSGLGELVSALTAVKHAGGQLKLLKLTKRIEDLMQITKLYTVFDIFDDEAEAVASFAK